MHGLGEFVRAPIVVCNEAHRFLVAEQMRELDMRAGTIVLEPEGRNTAPAAAVAALIALQASEPGEDPLLIVLPADHAIQSRSAFATAVDSAVQAALHGNLVTFGVVPDRAETGYGYIRRGADMGKWSVVESFVEKPDGERAQRYVDSGDYLWNSGMFVFSAQAYLRELGRYDSAMVAVCTDAVRGGASGEDFTRLDASFSECRSDSIDQAVMERTDRAVVISLNAGWSDVGSWAALHELLPKDSNRNVLRGNTVLESCKDCYVEAEARLVAAVGLEGVIIVDTGDALLVAAKGESQQIKRIVDVLKQQRRLELASLKTTV
jgi:mannose-1-phosphate guanylyltransferase/mannose-6-phosphate isomerase